MSTFDVIVPCYKYGKYLRECVTSVLAQEGVDVNVLIIDDASPDETPAVARELAEADSRVIYRRHERNRGHIATYNEGIDWVTAKYYLLLSADDYLLPGALRRAAALMDADSSVGFCYGAALEVFPDGKSARAMADVAPPDSDQPVAMSGREFIELCSRHGCINIVPTPTAIVRTDLQKATDGYRAELPHSGDMELWLRLAAHARVGFVGVPQAVYRRHSANMSLAYSGANILLDLRQREQAIEWVFRICGHQLADGSGLRRSMLAQLGRQALGQASACLNEGRPELARDFVAFSRVVHPTGFCSAAGFRFASNKLLGRRVTNALLFARDGFRRVAN